MPYTYDAGDGMVYQQSLGDFCNIQMRAPGYWEIRADGIQENSVSFHPADHHGQQQIFQV
ncbi:hypothetical protein D9M68_849230 [compost metagenome]